MGEIWIAGNRSALRKKCFAKPCKSALPFVFTGGGLGLWAGGLSGGEVPPIDLVPDHAFFYISLTLIWMRPLHSPLSLRCFVDEVARETDPLWRSHLKAILGGTLTGGCLPGGVLVSAFAGGGGTLVP